MKAAIFFFIQLAACCELFPPTNSHATVTLFTEPKCAPTSLDNGLNGTAVVIKDLECYDVSQLGVESFDSMIFEYQDSFKIDPESNVQFAMVVAGWTDEACGKEGGKLASRGALNPRKNQRISKCINGRDGKKAKSVVFTPLLFPAGK